MKILHTEWSDGWGGQEIRILTEMIVMREEGYEIFLACRAHAQIKEKAEAEGFKVYTLPFKGNTDLRTLWELIRIIRKENIDIVNTHSGKDTWVGGIAAKLSGAKFIRTRHLSNPIRKSRLNFINEWADFVMTTGESVREDMIRNNRVSPQKIRSVPTGIDAKRFDPSRYNREKLREVFGIAKDEVAIGMIAVLREFKNHELFLAAAREIVPLFPNTKFFIAGEGPRRQVIEALIASYGLSKNVKMLGHVGKPEELLSALDIFMLTSHSKEGVPQSVNQALMMKKCVIATDVGSTRDLHHQDNFYLVSPDDLEGIVAILKELISNGEKRSKCSDEARAYTAAHFSLDQMRREIREIYESLRQRGERQ